MLGFVSGKTDQETCMFCLLCLVAVAELRHLEMVCARLYSVIFVNMKICKMDSCGWHCACLIHVWEAVHDMCFDLVSLFMKDGHCNYCLCFI